jgi:1-deoxy-D-xylulose-5-phosphate reductoisomerase
VLVSPRQQPELRILILGSTGSIGTQTLDVIAHLSAQHSDAAAGLPPLRLVGLAAGSNAALLADQAHAFNVRHTVSAKHDGPHAAEKLVREIDCDVIVAAMVGAAGLPATLTAAELGRTILLANKETLVAAGSIVRAACQRTGAKLLPIDSEHAGLWQCLGPGCTPPCSVPASVKRLILTASGGPFRDLSAEACYHATPTEALKHPNWSMGSKITIDSATMMNKAFELIEALWLFGVKPEQLSAVIHPQSIVHAMVEFVDGSIINQMGTPDMRMAIQQGLVVAATQHLQHASILPRLPARSPSLDLATLSRLDFRPADPARWPALELAGEVMRQGSPADPGSATTAGAIVNGANEIAVRAFLEGRIPFGRIVQIAQETLARVPAQPLHALGDALDADRNARECAHHLVS